MKKRALITLGIAMMSVFALGSGASANTSTTLASSLAGRIVLQVEQHGEAYYIDPVSLRRSYLGTPQDAFLLLTSKGLGITHAELSAYLASTFPARLSGRILLDVEMKGQAYYVDPLTLRATYLGTPTDAWTLMRSKGLGITNANLALITSESLEVSILARAAFNKVNEYRVAHGRAALTWNAKIAQQAETHSENMADGDVAFGHDGFASRILAIRAFLTFGASAENVAMTSDENMVKSAVQAWLASDEHLENIMNASFDTTGIGVSADGNTYFFTEIFVDDN